jgi:hypothetical protein
MTFVRRFGILIVGAAATLVGVVIGAYDILKPISHDIDLTGFPTAAEIAQVQQVNAPYDDAPALWIAVGLVIVLVWIGLAPLQRLGNRAPIVRAGAAAVFGTALIVVGTVIGSSPWLPPERPDPHAVNITAVVDLPDTGPLGFSFGDPHAIVTFVVILIGCLLVAGAVGYAIAQRRAFILSPK